MASGLPLLPTPCTGIPLNNQHITLPAANLVDGHYIYMEDLARLNAYTDPDYSLTWPVCPSPIRLENWVPFLQSHPDKAFAAFIHKGLSEGFRVGFNRQGPRLHSHGRNHPSALANPSVVGAHIEAEVHAGRLVGPLQPAIVPRVHASPIGLVPKSHQVDKWRLIVDLSSPIHHSVNDGISPELCSLVYAKVDDAVQHILRLGRDTLLAKIDLKNAYRIVPIHPQDHHLLAVSWDGHTYVDRALPFGLRSAPKIFSAVADTIAWALHQVGVKQQIHYLDDFLLIGSPGTDEGLRALTVTLNTLNHLGVPVAEHKTEGPCCALVFLGILIDTTTFELRLPQEKLGTSSVAG